jgi:glycogen debranching enzyme
MTASTLDLQQLLHTLREVLDRETVESEIGTIVMPGPTYRGMWARDTAVVSLGLNRIGRADVSGELLRRYWSYQITSDSDPAAFIFRNKTRPDWTDGHAFIPTQEQLKAEVGAFPTSVYSDAPDFASGTREIYGARADIDGAAWQIIALQDHHAHTGADGVIRSLEVPLRAAISYLCSRDQDGDHLLEQGPNEDWADILLRRGKVSYTQAVWFRCLEAASAIFGSLGDSDRAEQCWEKGRSVKSAINETLMTPHGYYANYVDGDIVSLRRSLDTALLVAFGVTAPAQSGSVLRALESLDGPFGCSVIEPGYALDAIGPSKPVPGQYHNEGVWPWIASYYALAWARVGDLDRASAVICKLFEAQPDTVHEWIDNLTGEPHHRDFATAAGALVWVITEAGLA